MSRPAIVYEHTCLSCGYPSLSAVCPFCRPTVLHQRAIAYLQGVYRTLLESLEGI